MKTKAIILAALAVCLSCVSASAKDEKNKNAQEQFAYDIEYVKSAGDGISVVKVWSYGKSHKDAENGCKRSAVHGVVFKGYSGQGGYFSPLVKSATGYNDNKDFFDTFFNNGEYERYVMSIADGSQEVRKLKGNYKYKVSAVITVNTKQLRKHLEQAGIIKGLASGF